MQRIRIVLVEPEYEVNLGAVARLAGNFGLSRIYLVNPKCEVGFTAKMHAKHAANYLENAAICKSIKEACKGCCLVVGTSGILRRHRKILRTPISPRQLSGRLDEHTKGEVAVLFGREGIGLMANELTECDILCCVPTSRKYPVMNLSHAVAVMLYELTASGKKLPRDKEEASKGEARALAAAFDRLVDLQSMNIRNVEKTKLAFKTVFGRAVPSQVELRCMLGIIHSTLRDVEAKKKISASPK